MADEYIKRSNVLRIVSARLKPCNALIGDLCNACEDVYRMVELIPSADVQPVRRGKWIEKPAYEEDKEMGFDIQIVCSECDAQNSRLILNEYYEPIEKMFISSRFCPNCGADMRMDGE